MQEIIEFQYKARFGLLLYGLYRTLQFTAFYSSPFAQHLKKKDFNFSMTSKDKEIIRYFKIAEGKVYSRRIPMPVDFSLVWKDEPTAVRVMTDLVMGKRKVLAKAVVAQELFLEGDAGAVYSFLEIVNEMTRVYFKKKSRKKKK